eukprot:Plantae.Rhodophyta-Rhodochaete_pulchella.ctg713.p1 GENE.Plantae.Rhodophyta-Rhodochaete_pulchella.ctg713~~Plantae.Rhodophyta-Rhodochaete_pulchella.ctg713.p1  ORF type:complete len:286 (-),score=42.18 Plantae.Rhodophyta-Rhodochaete_pulchella.ctg713:678-1454(-)
MAQVEEWFKSMPPVTRTYVTIAVLTTTACALDMVERLKLHMDWQSVIYRYQFWRIFTNFFFFGETLHIQFVFKMFFLYRYSKLLEINSFRGRTADYLFMLMFGGFLCLILAIYLTSVPYFSESLTMMIVYVWGRKNAQLVMNFLGLFNFRAPYLAWVFLLFNVIFHGNYKTDLVGIVMGHIYYYLSDVYPSMPGGSRPLRTPRVLLRIFGNNDDFLAAEAVADEVDRRGAQEQRGWGQGRNIAAAPNNRQEDDHEHND